MANTFHDGNHVPVLIATSSSDGVSPVLLWADPVTHRLLVTSAGGTISVTDGVTTVTSVTEIDFVSGATVANGGGGVAQVTISGGGSSGFQRPLSGGLSGTNTWSTAPNSITVDNLTLQKTSTNGQVNWTGTTTTVLTVQPTQDIFSLG